MAPEFNWAVIAKMVRVFIKQAMTDAAGKQTSLEGQDAFLPPNTRRSLPIALLRAREAVMENFRPMLAKHDLTEQQWRVIRILAEQGVIDASDMADKAFILPPSLTRIIRTLEERGLILKLRDDNDGRRVLLEITASGLSIIEQVAPESKAIYDRLQSRFGVAKINILLDLLDELADLSKQG